VQTQLTRLSPFAPSVLTFGLALSLATGCADDVSTEGSDEVGTETDSDTDTDTETGESGSDTETETETETETGVTEIIVAGEVTDFFTMQGIAGADIAVIDMPGFETVSDDEGKYSISGLPPETELFFRIDGDEESYWGGIRPAMTPDMDTDDLQLGLVSNALIDTQLGYLQMQNMDVEADETKAVTIVRLLHPTATEEGATVTFDPPLPPDTFYGVGADDLPVLNTTEILSGLLPFWVAFNLDPAELGTYSVSVEHPTRECTVLHPQFPTMPRYVTLIDVSCPPMD